MNPTSVPYKFYLVTVNGRQIPQVLPAYNPPAGSEEVDYSTWKQKASQSGGFDSQGNQIPGTENMSLSQWYAYANSKGIQGYFLPQGQTYYDQAKANPNVSSAIQAADSGKVPASSGYSLLNGAFIKDSDLAKVQADLASGSSTIKDGQVVPTAKPATTGAPPTGTSSSGSFSSPAGGTTTSTPSFSTAGLPTTNLQPGQSGPQVAALQQWLIQNGFSISAGATGYYGDQTKAAVAKLQQSLGMSVSPSESGYFGPKTMQAIQTPASNQGSKDTPGPGANLTEDQMLQYALKTGITAEQYAKLDASQKAVVSMLGETAGQLYSNSSGGLTLDEALKRAASDPNLTAKYADALNLDHTQFTQAVNQLVTDSSQQSKDYKTKFENDRKALAEAHASAGTAYSGFRGKAQADLAQSESGIVQSTRSTLQKNLDQLTSAFESKYGTEATKAATLSYSDPNKTAEVGLSGLGTQADSTPDTLSGTVAGNVTGSNVISKNQDITSLAEQFYKDAQLPTL